MNEETKKKLIAVAENDLEKSRVLHSQAILRERLNPNNPRFRRQVLDLSMSVSVRERTLKAIQATATHRDGIVVPDTTDPSRDTVRGFLVLGMVALVVVVFFLNR